MLGAAGLQCTLIVWIKSLKDEKQKTKYEKHKNENEKQKQKTQTHKIVLRRL